MPIHRSLLLAALLCGASTAVLAQTTPAQAPPRAPATVEAVVVTGAAGEVTTSIDRRSYSLGKDIAASSGSVADALRNVPAVSVDMQGVLSLRGDTNVTILVDGKPSGAFEGQGRADALQQFPADQIERVEVITNPSAALNPEGSGGVINLITKQSKGAGWTSSAYATAGSAGLKRAGASFGYNSAKLNVTGSLAGNYQRNKNRSELLRSTLIPASGLFSDQDTYTIGRSLNRGPTAKLTVGYALTPKDQLTANASYNSVLIYAYPFTRFEDRDSADAITGFLDRQGKRHNEFKDLSLSGGWRHTFGDGHTLSLDAVRNRNQYGDEQLWTTLRSVPIRPLLELNEQAFVQRHSELKATYVRPLEDGGKLTAGYELKVDDNNYDAETSRGPIPFGLILDPTTAYRFDFGQTINAGYATLERRFGDLTVQGGLRVEDAKLKIDERSSPSYRPDYLRAYPSLHLGYKLSDEHKISASYSKRVQRPPAFLLNPFPVYADPKTVQQGNPNLLPQETDSFELGFERRKAATTLLATAYYRQSQGEFSPIGRIQPNGNLLVTFDNLGSSKTAGVELVANTKLGTKVTLSSNANLFYKEISATNLGIAGSRSTYGGGGRVNLDWQARPNDLLQINATVRAKQLYAQGLQEANWTVNLGWRHKVNDAATATVSVQDLFNTNTQVQAITSPEQRLRGEFRPVSRAISVRLDYRFGAKSKTPAPEPGFDYGAPAAGL
jgi:outer membrane receptor protein involved in Fe transport